MLDTTKEYIMEQIRKKGLDEYNQVCIDFAGICEEEEMEHAARELGFNISPGEGEGVWWLVKED